MPGYMWIKRLVLCGQSQPYLHMCTWICWKSLERLSRTFTSTYLSTT